MNPQTNRDRDLRGALPLGENDRVRQEAFSPGPLPSRGQFSRRLLDRIANFLCSNFQCPRQRGHEVACLREIAGAEAGETTKPFADVGVAAPFHEHDGGEIEDGESTRNQSVYWQDFFSRQPRRARPLSGRPSTNVNGQTMGMTSARSEQGTGPPLGIEEVTRAAAALK